MERDLQGNLVVNTVGGCWRQSQAFGSELSWASGSSGAAQARGMGLWRGRGNRQGLGQRMNWRQSWKPPTLTNQTETVEPHGLSRFCLSSVKMAIVGLPNTYGVNQSNKSLLMHIHSNSSVPQCQGYRCLWLYLAFTWEPRIWTQVPSFAWLYWLSHLFILSISCFFPVPIYYLSLLYNLHMMALKS